MDNLEIRSIRPSNKCPNGILDLTINSGTGPYDVVWSWEFIPGFNRVISSVNAVNGFDGREDVTGLPPGDYNVVVTDALCGTARIDITLEEGLSSQWSVANLSPT
jgi:hypothetical protein